MPNHEDSQPGRRRGVNGVTRGAPEVDDTTIIGIGLAVQAWGSALAEHGRIRRGLTPAQRAAAAAKLVEIAQGFTGDLDTLVIGLRAEVRQANG